MDAVNLCYEILFDQKEVNLDDVKLACIVYLTTQYNSILARKSSNKARTRWPKARNCSNTIFMFEHQHYSKWLVGKVIPKILPIVVAIIYYNRSVVVLTLHTKTIPTSKKFVTLHCKMA